MTEICVFLVVLGATMLITDSPLWQVLPLALIGWWLGGKLSQFVHKK